MAVVKSHGILSKYSFNRSGSIGADALSKGFVFAKCLQYSPELALVISQASQMCPQTSLAPMFNRAEASIYTTEKDF